MPQEEIIKLFPRPGNLPDNRRDRHRQFIMKVAQNPEYFRVFSWFLGVGEFAPKEDGTPHERYIPVGVINFLDSVRTGYEEWGSITKPQYDIIQSMYLDHVGPIEVAPQELAEEQANADKFFGEIGERHKLHLFVTRAIKIPARPAKKIPARTIHIMHDRDGLEFVWSAGRSFLQPQTHIVVFGVVHSHVHHKGRAQTHLSNFRLVTTRQPRRYKHASNQD
jgi:hypothetical protein